MSSTIHQVLWTTVPSIIIFLCFYPYRKTVLDAMKLHSSYFREAGLILYIGILSGLCAQKLLPSYFMEPTSGIWGDVILLTNRPTWDYMVNLKPLSMLSDYYRYYSQLGTADLFGIVSNILSNILSFIPVSFLTSLLFRKPTWKRSVLICTGIAFFTETAQYFVVRNVSVDDLILNTIGVMLGYWLYLFVRKKFPEFTNRFVCKAQNST